MNKFCNFDLYNNVMCLLKVYDATDVVYAIVISIVFFVEIIISTTWACGTWYR
jgi:hypothetical protein